MNKKKVKEGVINEAALEALIAEHGHSPEAVPSALLKLAAAGTSHSGSSPRKQGDSPRRTERGNTA